MNLPQPRGQRSHNRSLPPSTYNQYATEPEKLLALYISLSASERAACFINSSYVAKQYGVPLRTLQRWIDCGWIIAVRLGKNYKVYTPSVMEFLHHCAEV